MAPRTEHRATSRTGRSICDRRIAHTGSGVNSSRPSAVGCRGGGDSYRPSYHNGGGRPLAPPGGRLLDHITFDDEQRSRTRAPDPRPRPRLQQGGRRRLQDHITYGNGIGNDSGGAVAFYCRNDGGGVAFPRQGQGLAARIARNVDDAAPATNLHEASSTNGFYASQLSQILPDDKRPLFRVTASGRFAIFARAQARNPIRMLNQPINSNCVPPTNDKVTEPASSKRPANTYCGKDTIKLMVQNAKLRAILSGKRLQTERRKSGEEKPLLRMGMSHVTK